MNSIIIRGIVMIDTHFLALVPYYDEFGQNCTRVIKTDRNNIDYKCCVKAYISKLLYLMHLDPRALSFWSSKILGTKLNVPIMIHPDFILLPFKARKSIGRQDGCFGYVTLNAIKEIEDMSITLTNDTILPTLSTKSYMLKKKKDATLLSYAYLDQRKKYEFMWFK